MSKYNVNFRKLALLILPTFMRRPVLAALAYALVAPFRAVQMQFASFRTEVDYRLSHNGQMCYLEAILNDIFDPGKRGITITENHADQPAVTLYHRSEGRALLLSARASGRAVILNRRGFGGVNGYDFWINIPPEISAKTDITRLKAIVNTYKLASKRYAIN